MGGGGGGGGGGWGRQEGFIDKVVGKVFYCYVNNTTDSMSIA